MELPRSNSSAVGMDNSSPPAVIEDLERKVRLREHYGAELSNIMLATM
jgi:hypothetical protein